MSPPGPHSALSWLLFFGVLWLWHFLNFYLFLMSFTETSPLRFLFVCFLGGLGWLCLYLFTETIAHSVARLVSSACNHLDSFSWGLGWQAWATTLGLSYWNSFETMVRNLEVFPTNMVFLVKILNLNTEWVLVLFPPFRGLLFFSPCSRRKSLDTARMLSGGICEDEVSMSNVFYFNRTFLILAHPCSLCVLVNPLVYIL